jgi:uncharacterized protein with HEPN domain
MDIEQKTWLFDIINAINEIEQFTVGVESVSDLQNNKVIVRAVERNIEIIGEAMNRLLEKQVQLEITNARKIVDTRNRIIHGYDSVSEAIIWQHCKRAPSAT